MSLEQIFPMPHNFKFEVDVFTFEVNIVDRTTFGMTIRLNENSSIVDQQHGFWDECIDSVRNFIVKAPNCIHRKLTEAIGQLIISHNITTPPGLVNAIDNLSKHHFYRNLKLKNQFIYHTMKFDVPVNEIFLISGTVNFSGMEIVLVAHLDEMNADRKLKTRHGTSTQLALVELRDTFSNNNIDDPDSVTLKCFLTDEMSTLISGSASKDSLELATNLIREVIEKFEDTYNDLAPEDNENWTPYFGATRAFCKLKELIEDLDVKAAGHISNFSYVSLFPNDIEIDLLERQNVALDSKLEKIYNDTLKSISKVDRDSERECDNLRNSVDPNDYANMTETMAETMAKTALIVAKHNAVKSEIISKSKAERQQLIKRVSEKKRELEMSFLKNRVGDGGAIGKKD